VTVPVITAAIVLSERGVMRGHLSLVALLFFPLQPCLARPVMLFGQMMRSAIPIASKFREFTTAAGAEHFRRTAGEIT
jgi:hypothetical protein